MKELVRYLEKGLNDLINTKIPIRFPIREYMSLKATTKEMQEKQYQRTGNANIQ